MKTDQITVVIPLYNKERWVGRALASVLEQSHPPAEVIVVDDGSTDASAAVVESIKDCRIKLIRQNNQGVSVARNRGTQEAQSRWVAFLDADDWWFPRFLETCQSLLYYAPNAVLLGTNVSLGELGKTAFECSGPDPWIIHDFAEAAVDQLYPPIPNCSCVVDKDALHRAGGFPKGVALGEDVDTWLRLSLQGPFALSRNANIYYEFEDTQSAVRRLSPICGPNFPPAVATYKRLRGTLDRTRNQTFMRYARFCLAQCMQDSQGRSDWRNVISIFRHHSDVAGFPLVIDLLRSVSRSAFYKMRARVGFRSRLRRFRRRIGM